MELIWLRVGKTHDLLGSYVSSSTPLSYPPIPELPHFSSGNNTAHSLRQISQKENEILGC